MKYVKLLFLTCILFVLFIGDSVFAEEVTPTPTPTQEQIIGWIDSGTHSYTTTDNPWVSWGQFTYQGDTRQPATANYMYDSGGVTILYNRPDSDFHQFIWMGLNNEAKFNFGYNLANILGNGGEFDNTWTSTPGKLNSVIDFLMDGTFKTAFPEIIPYANDIYYAGGSYTGSLLDQNFDITVTSGEQLRRQLEDNNWEINNGGGGDPWLPNLTFCLSRKTTYVFPNTFDTKCFIDWDYTEREIYSSNPSDYVVDVQVSGSVNQAGVLNGDNLVPQIGHILTLSSGGCNVALNQFTFLYQAVGKQFYQSYGFTEFPPRDNNSAGMSAGYFLYLRTREISTNRISPWKIFSAVGGQFFPVNKTIEGSDGDYTIEDVPQDELDNSDNSLIIDYTSDNNNSAEDDPTSQMYNEESQYNVSALVNNLKSAVNSLRDLPTLMSQVLSFMPEWLATLIAVSIGMIVVIGVVKHIIR